MRARTPKPAAPPLADTLRAALAQDWHTLDALEALAGRAPAARHRVHAALAELRADGVVLEERVTRGVAEVRELPPVADGATCPACRRVVREIEDHAGSCGIGIRDCSWWAARPPLHSAADDGPGVVVLVDDLPHPFGPPPGWEPSGVEVASAGTAEPCTGLDAPAPPVDQAAPVEAADGAATGARGPSPSRAEALAARPFVCFECGTPTAERTCLCGGEVGKRPLMGDAPSKGPGPGAQCAVCGVTYAAHWTHLTPAVQPKGHPFTPKPRGRPRVAALDAPPVESAAAAGGTEPETSRGEAPGDQANGKQEQSEATDMGTTDDGAEGEREAPHPASGGGRARVGRQYAVHERVSGEVEGASRRAPRRGGKTDEPVGLTRPPPCRPPLCHADDIHVPSAVRGFARPLCERHRAWVEGAGGTLAAGGLAGVLP